MRLEGLEPCMVFKYFEEIAAVPHGSGDTAKIAQYLIDFAKDKGLKYYTDDSNNVIIFKDGTSTYENSQPVIIQGHTDMVCEKNDECTIDFTKDGLDIRTDGEKIWAEGTTLGGDDGIAVAMALAILASDDIPHPPIEAVFTVDEEIGMLGAAALDCSSLKGKLMLNLDSEDEGILLVSCAGGATAQLTLELQCEEADTSKGILAKLMVSGCTGGHSGVEINKQRANASKVLGRLINVNKDIKGVHLVSVTGGSKDNAIPREAEAKIYFDDEASYNTFGAKIEEYKKIVEDEYSFTDKNLEVTMEKVTDEAFTKILTDDAYNKLAMALVLSPDGIKRMSNEMEGMVQTSLNLGIMKLTDEAGCKKLSLSFCVRSSVMSEKDALIDELNVLADVLGGCLNVTGDYPAWEYKKDSKLRGIMTDCFKELYGREPKLMSIHAGVECGIFAGKIKGLDCVSYGPDMADIHTTAETLYVDSVRRTYEYTLAILKSLK